MCTMNYSGTVTLPVLQKEVHDPTYVAECFRHEGCRVIRFLAKMAYLGNISHLAILSIELKKYTAAYI